MLAAAMTNRGPMNTGGATTMQNPRNAPGFKQANQAGLQQRLSALTPSQMQAHQQFLAANQQRQQAAPMQMQAGNTNASLAAAAYNQQPAMLAPAASSNPFAQQQAMNAQMGVFQQPQLQSANAQNAQLAYNANAQAQQQAMNAQMGMAAMQNPYGMANQQRPSPAPMQMQAASGMQQSNIAQAAQFNNQAQQAMSAQQQAMNSQSGMAAMQNPYGMTMGGGGFNERGSASSPIGMSLSQLQAPYMSQPMAYGGSSVPASAYMF